ncbi:MAG: hypothetical protein HC837_02500 [Chloroflexaceae bacterium]|nr:hypothetical protein [Chloroflexaceae bacterium]
MPGLAILVVLIVLLTAWLLWLFLFPIPLYVTSKAAHSTPDAFVIAQFPSDVIEQITIGQQGLFVPENSDTRRAMSAVDMTVVDIEPEQNTVILMVSDDVFGQHNRISEQPGEVQIAVVYQTPLGFLFESSRIHP